MQLCSMYLSHDDVIVIITKYIVLPKLLHYYWNICILTIYYYWNICILIIYYYWNICILTIYYYWNFCFLTIYYYWNNNYNKKVISRQIILINYLFIQKMLPGSFKKGWFLAVLVRGRSYLSWNTDNTVNSTGFLENPNVNNQRGRPNLSLPNLKQKG